MRVASFIHPSRTFLPCTGVGRHMNRLLLGMQDSGRAELSLIFSRQWLGPDGRLPPNCPLRDLPFTSFAWPENPVERSWKLLGIPWMDASIPPGTDWIYCPMETLFPTRARRRIAITLHDVHPFEPDLPWRNPREHAWQRWKWGRWVRRAIASCEVVFTVSEFSKRRMVELLGAPAGKIVVAGNGIDETYFAAGAADATTFPRPMPEPYVLMVGGLRPAKGGVHLLAVAERLRDRPGDIQVVVTGPNDPALAAAAASLPNVHLVGVVPDDELPGMARHAVAAVFLSLYEGFGIPPLEAMAAGTPAIVSDRASLPEVVGDAGFVVAPEDAGAVTEIVEKLAADGPFRRDAAARSRAHAAAYTWGRCVETVLDRLERGPG